MPTAYLVKKNFSSKLPDDFMQLISIKNQYGYLPISDFMEQGRIDYFGYYRSETFHIKENMIYFSGSYSRWWIIRIFQKLKDRMFPMVYRISYVDVKKFNELKSKYPYYPYV